MDFIQGERFMEIADFTYAPRIKHKDDYYNFASTVNWEELKDITVIGTLPTYVTTLFNIIQHLKPKFIILTYNSDCRIEEQGIVTPDGRSNEETIEPYDIPDNVLIWYSANVNVKHSKILSIPIGVENMRWQGNPPKKEQMITKSMEPRIYKNLLYINHSIGTNVKQREEPYKLLERKPWVTSHRGHNGLNFGVYIDNVYNHKFMICPEGNGIDTHRTWECLYMGTIPIEKRNINNQFYTDLPICFVDSWKEITKDFLDKEYKRIKNSVWNLDKLTFKYWVAVIYDTKVKLNILTESGLHSKLEKNKVMVQIGTNNGVDKFNRIVKGFSPSKVILVEPNKKHNVSILNRYSGIDNVFIENVAITDTDKGLVKLVFPKNSKIHNDSHYSLLPMDDWGDNLEEIQSESMTFTKLCEKYNMTNIHYLQIDTEGYDVEILKTIDFKKINIDIIKYENWRFPEDCFTRYGEKGKLYGLNGIKAAAVLLEGVGYEIHADWGDDTVAIKSKINY